MIGETPREESRYARRDETAATICGLPTPADKPLGPCIFCGGDIWPEEDEFWDGAEFHYITFAYHCSGCGRFDVAPFYRET